MLFSVMSWDIIYKHKYNIKQAIADLTRMGTLKRQKIIIKQLN